MNRANSSCQSKPTPTQPTASPTGSIVSANPFSSRFVRPDQMNYVLAADHSWEQVIEQFAKCRWRGQIVGPHGTGKTTLMWNLIGKLSASFQTVRFVQLQENASRLDQATVLFESEAPQPVANSQKDPRLDQLLLIDGFERLNRWRQFRIRATSKYAGMAILVSSHRRVGLPTILETRTSGQQLHSLVNSLSDGQMRFSISDAEELLERHQGNAREALFELYDVWELQRD